MHDGAPTELERLTRENAELRAELSRQAQTASELAARIGHSGDGFERLVSARTAELETVTARLLAATSAAKIGIWDWDVVQNILTWDDGMYRLYEQNRADFSGAYDAWRQALHLDDARVTERALEDALAGRADFNVTFRIHTPSGPIRHVRAAAIVYRDSKGRPLRMLGVNWDVTAEIEAQAARRASEERWNLALKCTGQGVWDWDIASNLVFLSERSRELVGTDREEVSRSEFLATHVHPDDLAGAAAALDRHLRGETEIFSAEVRYRRPAGGYRWILSSARVIARDAAGKPLRVVGTHKDIEERKGAQQALAHREALLREFITHTPAAIAVLDRELRYVQASRRWLIDYKLEGQDIIGRSHYEVFPDIPESWKEVHRRVLAGAIESRQEDPFRRADGRTEWLRWEVRPWYELDGTIGGVIFFTQVITEQKELALKVTAQNKTLARSNAELEQFAYVASHDLQEPLRAVAGCTQILAQRYRGSLDTKADTLIQHIVDGVARMKDLIDDLLTLSRVSTQHELTSVDTADLVRQALANLAASIREKRAEVAVGSLPRVRGEPTQLIQLFQNLVGNALKYASNQPPRIEIAANRAGEAYEFSVRDNGIGISPEYFERIFGVFQRLHTREEYPGTGIGLAICRKTVEQHGGRIWVESVLGGGSTFHFTLLSEESRPPSPDVEGSPK